MKGDSYVHGVLVLDSSLRKNGTKQMLCEELPQPCRFNQYLASSMPKNGTKADIIMVTADVTEAARLVLRKLYTEVVPVDWFSGNCTLKWSL